MSTKWSLPIIVDVLNLTLSTRLVSFCLCFLNRN